MHQDRTTRRSAIGIAAALIFGIGITAGTGIGSAPAYAETDEEIAVSLASLPARFAGGDLKESKTHQ